MNSKRYHYSRKFRQLRHLLKTVQRMKSAGELSTLAEAKLQKMVNKLNRLYHQLKRVIAPTTLRKAMMGTALALGMTTFASAQSFGDGQTNPFGIMPPDWGLPALVDIDGDGDLDMMSASYDYASLSYFNLQFFENTGDASAATFGEGTLNPFGLTAYDYYNTEPTFADMDNDGDMDMITGGLFGYGFIRYYENTGTADAPTFASGIVDPFGISFYDALTFATAGDIDGDGDIDLIAASYYGTFNYWENTGTPEAPAFAAPQTNPFGITLPATAVVIVPVFTDIDQDGDLDILGQNYYFDPGLVYWENSGTADAPAFEAPVTNPFGLTADFGTYVATPTTGDLDGDGDIDIMVGTNNYGEFVYFENVGVAPTSEDATITAQENQSYTFDGSEFAFTDPDGGSLEGVEITTLTSGGILELGGNAVTAGDVLGTADLANLTYTPDANEFGPAYDSFTFRVFDGGLFSDPANTITIDVEENTAVVERLENLEVTIAPNPVTSTFNLEATFGDRFESATLRIVNSLGQVMHVQDLGNNQVVQEQFEVANWPAGTYFVEISANDKVWTGRFLKQ